MEHCLINCKKREGYYLSTMKVFSIASQERKRERRGIKEERIINDKQIERASKYLQVIASTKCVLYMSMKIFLVIEITSHQNS